MPSTFAAFATFAQKYIALPRETRAGTNFDASITDLASSGSKRNYLEYLISIYAADLESEGLPINFDTPAFRAALEDIERMHAAFKSDTKKTYGEGKTLYSVTNTASRGFLQDDIYVIHVTDSDKIPAKLGVLVVNANTAHKAEALDYLALAMQKPMRHYGAELYDVYDYDAALIQSYNENIEEQKRQNGDQSVIDGLIKLRDADDPTYFIERELIDSYRVKVAPCLSFSALPDYINGISELTGAYAEGKILEDKLVESLNTLYQWTVSIRKQPPNTKIVIDS